MTKLQATIIIIISLLLLITSILIYGVRKEYSGYCLGRELENIKNAPMVHLDSNIPICIDNQRIYRVQKIKNKFKIVR